MICQQCGKENDPDARFCVQCSQPLHITCSSCSTQNDHDALFCKNCGAALDHAAAETQADRLQSLKDTASKSLQSKLRKAEKEIEGQRKPVTILFADIVGSTSIAEKLDPEEWKEVVQGAHRCVSEAVHRYEGTIAQLLGDGVMAFFGAPLTHEDDPERAVRAGLDLQERITEYRRELAGFVDDFHMRVGIHTGEVVVGPVGTDQRTEYLAIGDAVNVAARLESAAEADRVLVSQACANFIQHAFDLEEMKAITAKGKSEPVNAATVLRRKDRPALARRLSNLRTPFVGRELELERTGQAIKALCQGQGQILILTGEAGVGKTRLLEEARDKSCRDSGAAGETHFEGQSIRWLEGRALSYGGSLSLWTIRQLLLADLGLSDGSSTIKIKAAFRRRIEALFEREMARQSLPYLAHLLDLQLDPGESRAIQDMDGEAIKHQALINLREYFKAAAAEHPTALVFEDLHWADPSSLEVLETLTPLVDQVPILFVLLLRIEREHPSWGLKTAIENDFPHRTMLIELHRLSDHESQQLVEQLLLPGALPERVRQLILTRSEGNPFYLEEIARHLLDSGLIEEVDGNWRVKEEIVEIGIPKTLQGVLLARIDRLEEDVRATLQMASVIGKTFLYRILEVIAEAEQQLEGHLAELQKLDLVREKSRLPELEYIFKHSLTQEAAYHSLLVERRRSFHQKVGEALEQLFPDRQEEYLGLLAYHFNAARNISKASKYLILAGDKERLADAHTEAVEYYRQAMPLLEEQGEVKTARQLWLRIGLSNLINFRLEEANEAYEEAARLQDLIFCRPVHPLKPKTLRFPIDRESVTTLDPSKELYDNFALSLLFLGLARMTSGISIEPYAARSWKVFKNGKQYTFHLREDLHWSDGMPLTAYDFEWTWLRNLSPDVNCPYAFYFDNIVGARAFREGKSHDRDSLGIRALDEVTFEVDLNTPSPYFLYLTTMPAMYAIPRATIERYGEEWSYPENIVCSGPYILESLDEQTVTLIKNKQYSLSFPGNVHKITGSTFEGPTIEEARERMIASFLNGHFDKIWSLPEIVPDTIRPFEAEPGKHLEDFFVRYAMLNPTHQHMDNIDFRRALVMSIDRDMLLEYGTPALGGLVHPAIPGHSPNLGYPLNMEQARLHLTQSGLLKTGHGLDIKVRIEREDRIFNAMARGLKAQWEKNLSIKVQLVGGEFTSKIEHADIYITSWIPDFPDPGTYLIDAMKFSLLETYGYSNRKLDQLYAQLICSADRQERMILIREIDRFLVREECLLLPLLYNPTGRHKAYIKPNIKNLDSAYPAYENVVIED